MEENRPEIELLKGNFPGSVLETVTFRGEITLCIKGEDLLVITRFLQGEPQTSFDYLSSISSVDYRFTENPRFELVYHLYSIKNNRRLVLKVATNPDSPKVPSLTGIYRTANFHEREVFDLMGIEFVGHPDLKRILLPEDFNGYPLRKDFPLEGKDDGD